MAINEISLSTSYVPEWGVWEGIREIVQNGKDGEVEHNAPLNVRMTDSGTLIIENEGVVLPRETLLIGYSTKAHNSDALGQFGEGLKLGAMALVRDGYPITINNGDEIWKPIIVQSNKFNAEVLAFDITKSKKKNFTKKLTVSIKNVGVENWKDLSKFFLFLQKPEVVYEGRDGTLIMDKEYSGMLFLKSIFVTRDVSLNYGYNLKRGKLDRDRKMVDRFDQRYEISQIYAEAIQNDSAHKEVLVEKAMESLSNGTDETAHFNFVASTETLDALSNKFTGEYGDNAVPVQSLSDSKELEHYGGKGVVVSGNLKEVLERKLGTFKENKQKLVNSNIKYLSWHDLDDVQKKNFNCAIEMISKVRQIDIDKIQIAEFAEFGIEGQYDSGNGNITISCHILYNLPKLLHTLVHEISHEYGDDGTQNHIVVMGDILAEIACLGVEV